MYGVFKEIFQLQEHVLSLKCMAYTVSEVLLAQGDSEGQGKAEG